MWGQVYYVFFFQFCTGIIPTRVGTSIYITFTAKVCWDHPHACGDKIITVETGATTKGSSPRVWGQVNFGEVIEDIFRIIPTRVGTSDKYQRHHADDGDHPHACGDKGIVLTSANIDSGSSPRVWGQVTLSAPSQPVRGIIPTRVGTRFTLTVAGNTA